MRTIEILNDLNKVLIPALGCTDPVSIAYTSSLARSINPGDVIKSIQIKLNYALFKNAVSVYIPNTEMFGIEYAVTLGAIVNAPEFKMELLRNITTEFIDEAKRFIDLKKVHVELIDKPFLTIVVDIMTEKGKSTAIMSHDYTHIELMKFNEEIILEDKWDDLCYKEKEKYKIHEIVEFATSTSLQDLKYVEDAIKMNTRFYEQSFINSNEIGIAKRLSEISNGNLWLDILSATSGASDSRMAGSSLAVMSNSGSGNQGLLSLLPVILMSKKLNLSEEECLRACALSAAVLMSIKQEFGLMSGMCSAVVASCGAAAGLTYLQTKDISKIELSIQNVIANVSGMYCDGAKTSCSLKVSTCGFAALLSSTLAINQEGVNHMSGFIEIDVNDTIANLSVLSQLSREKTDMKIIEFIAKKNQCIF